MIQIRTLRDRGQHYLFSTVFADTDRVELDEDFKAIHTIDGESYRMRAHRARSEATRKVVRGA